MTDEAQVSDIQPASAAPTLDDVIADFNVPAPEASPQNVAEFKPAQPQRIDAYDEEGLNKWASDMQSNQSALQGEIQRLNDAADATTKATEKAATEAKIQGAVKVITNGIEGLDPLAAEFILEKAARDNEKFAELFHNQDKNPDLYKSALGAIIAENDGKFQRVDTQIAENHRAAQQSTQSNNTPAQSSETPMEAVLAKAAVDGNLDYVWAKMRDGG